MMQIVLSGHLRRILAQLGLILMLYSSADCIADSLLISSDWSFRLVDGTLNIGGENDLRTLLAHNKRNNDMDAKWADSQIIKIVQSPQANIGYVVIGSIKDNRSYGVLTIRLRPIEIIGFIQKEIEGVADFPIEMIHHDNYLYLTSWVNKPEGTQLYAQTEVYDPISSRLMQTFTKTKFVINESTCDAKDLVYNGRLFNPKNGQETSRQGVPLGVYIDDCREGYALGLANSSVNDPAKILLARIDSNPIAKQEIPTNEQISGFGIDEWQLSPSARYVLRDEVTNTKRTGRIVFINTKSTRKSELVLKRSIFYGNGIVGFLSETQMIYCGGEAIQVVDIQKPAILATIGVRSCPIAVLSDVQGIVSTTQARTKVPASQ